MSVFIQPMSEITHRARHALVQELGIVDALRFLNQFRADNGNYAPKRERLFSGESVKNIAAIIRARRSDVS